MTHVAWRQSCLPPTHVIGVGCNLESERLSYTLNVALLANSTNKKAWVVGELSDNKGELRLFGMMIIHSNGGVDGECTVTLPVFDSPGLLTQC